jgi:hypothetical protein
MNIGSLIAQNGWGFGDEHRIQEALDEEGIEALDEEGVDIGCRCLLGWLNGFPKRFHNKVGRSIMRSINEYEGKKIFKMSSASPNDIAMYNDGDMEDRSYDRYEEWFSPEPEELAHIWNLAMADLGYTSGNPDA